MITFILTVTISLTVSALCSLAEACLLSFSLTDIAHLSEKKVFLANIWKQFKANIQKPIAVILVINTFAHTIGAAVSGAQFTHIFGPKWIAVYSLVFSIVMIQWTEILPKTLGVKYNRFLAPIITFPLNILVKVFSPFISLIQALNRPFEGKKKVHLEMDTLNDMLVLARFASLNKLISAEQKNILEKSIALSDKKVKDIMIKREEIKFLSTKMKLSEALIEAHIHHHTRFPLLNSENTEEVLGYVNFKDIISALKLNPPNPTLRGISRPILSVLDTDDLSHLLTKLIKSYQHIALVKDASGKLKGLVTLENVLEAIVGDIYDEYDVLPNYFYQIASNRYVVGGGVTLNQIEKDIGVHLGEPKQSLNDWLMKKVAKLPRVEDVIEHGQLKFIIRRISRSKIYEIILEKSA